MAILERLRRALSASSEPPQATSTDSQSSAFIGRWGSERQAPGAEHHVGVTPLSSGQAHLNPTARPPGPEQTTYPPVDPVPVYLFAVESAPHPAGPLGPGPNEVLQMTSGPHPSFPPLVTVYDHSQLLANYDAYHQVGKGPVPSGVERRPLV
jgi:hypothetical protein